MLTFVLAGCRSPTAGLPADWMAGDAMRTSHVGPLVGSGEVGPARFADRIYESFESRRALATVHHLVRLDRNPATPAYDAAIDHIVDELRAAGFGTSERLRLEILEDPTWSSAWSPVSARIDFRGRGGAWTQLAAFESEEDPARAMLPLNAPAAGVVGLVVFEAEEVAPGAIWVTTRPLEEVLGIATERRAAAVLSAYVPPSRESSTETAAAIALTRVPVGTRMAVAQISPDAFDVLRANPHAHLRLNARVNIELRAPRTVVATIVGVARPDETVVLFTPLDGRSASEASAPAGLLECARALSALTVGGDLLPAERNISFLFGTRARAVDAFLEFSREEVVAGFAGYRLGSSPALTGGVLLLERAPDPGAIEPLVPDEFGPLTKSQPSADQLHPTGLAIVARCALADVAELVGDWQTAEHPWQDSGPLVVLARLGVPTAAFWHFRDPVGGTQLDRPQRIDAGELARSSVALASTAMAVADARPADLKRYLDSLKLERRMRLRAAAELPTAELTELWVGWFDAARFWLRALCLGLPFEPPQARQGVSASALRVTGR